MKSIWTILAVAAVSAFLCGQAFAQDAAGTLYDQEGIVGVDGYATINAAGQGPNGPTGTVADSKTNWKYQYGAGTYTGIYRKDGWLDVNETGDSKIDIECDIEMYYTETFANNKIYFHIGDPFNASAADKKAVVNGTFTANNGMYIGISFDETSKTAADMLKDGAEKYTGEVRNAMVGTKDVLGNEMWIDKNNTALGRQSFNAKFTMDWSNNGGSTWIKDQVPVTFGTGASGTILNTLWWLINDGQKGSYLLKYNIELLMPVDQADGNYHFDPVIVAAPIL